MLQGLKFLTPASGSKKTHGRKLKVYILFVGVRRMCESILLVDLKGTNFVL